MANIFDDLASGLGSQPSQQPAGQLNLFDELAAMQQRVERSRALRASAAPPVIGPRLPAPGISREVAGIAGANVPQIPSDAVQQAGKTIFDDLAMAGVGLQQGFHALGEQGLTALQAGSEPLIEVGPYALTATGPRMRENAKDTAGFFREAALDARRRSQELEPLAEEIGGSRTMQAIGQGIPSIAPAIATGPLGAVAPIVASGVQQGLSTLSEAQSVFEAKPQLTRDGQVIPNPAFRAALGPALADTVTTAAITALSGKLFGKGVEGFSIPMRRQAIGNKITEVVKDMVGESLEEGAQQFVSDYVIGKLSYKPETTFEQAVTDALQAGIAGGVIGGAMGGLKFVPQQQPEPLPGFRVQVGIDDLGRPIYAERERRNAQQNQIAGPVEEAGGDQAGGVPGTGPRPKGPVQPPAQAGQAQAPGVVAPAPIAKLPYPKIQSPLTADDKVAREVENETGFTLVKKQQTAGGMALPTEEQWNAMPPELQARYNEVFASFPPSGWEWTDNREGSPTQGRTFRAPLGATKEEAMARFKEFVPELANEPTQAQKEAGNYPKEHVKVQGLDISIENKAGTQRTGTDKAGKPWSVTMPVDYGYIKRTTGKDGDQVDVYLGKSPDVDRVWVVNQQDPVTKKFDEHKVMMGFSSLAEAMAAYDAAFSDNSGPSRRESVAAMTVDQFKDWLKNGNTTKPVTTTLTAEDLAVGYMRNLLANPVTKNFTAEKAWDALLSKDKVKKDWFISTWHKLAGTTPTKEGEISGQKEKEGEGGQVRQPVLTPEGIQPPAPAPTSTRPPEVKAPGTSPGTGQGVSPRARWKQLTETGWNPEPIHPDYTEGYLPSVEYLDALKLPKLEGWGRKKLSWKPRGDGKGRVEGFAIHPGGIYAMSIYFDDPAKPYAELLTQRTYQGQKSWEVGTNPFEGTPEEVAAEMDRRTDYIKRKEAAQKGEPERIVATAVRNPQTGQVVSSPTKIHAQLYQEAGLTPQTMTAAQVEASSGYVTDRGRFVTQAEGQKIAEAQKLVRKGEDLMGEVVAERIGIPKVGDKDQYGRKYTNGDVDVIRGEVEAARRAAAPPQEPNPDGSLVVESGQPEPHKHGDANAKGSNYSTDPRKEKAVDFIRADLTSKTPSKDAHEAWLKYPDSEKNPDMKERVKEQTWFKFAYRWWSENWKPETDGQSIEQPDMAQADQPGPQAKLDKLLKENPDADDALQEYYGDQESMHLGHKTVSAEKIAEEKGRVLTKQEADNVKAQWAKQLLELDKKRRENGQKIILSLFDRTGAWAEPFVLAGFDVRTIDLVIDDVDVMDINQEWLADYDMTDIWGILSANPCDDFAGSGARWWAGKDESGKTDVSVKLAEHTLAIIEYLHPVFWALENPVGRLSRLVPGVGEPRLQFHPNQYGDPYTKRTQIFGNFNPNLPQANVFPDEASKMHNLRGDDPEQKLERSETPEGFALAFALAQMNVGPAEEMEKILGKKTPPKAPEPTKPEAKKPQPRPEGGSLRGKKKKTPVKPAPAPAEVVETSETTPSPPKEKTIGDYSQDEWDALIEGLEDALDAFAPARESLQGRTYGLGITDLFQFSDHARKNPEQTIAEAWADFKGDIEPANAKKIETVLREANLLQVPSIQPRQPKVQPRPKTSSLRSKKAKAAKPVAPGEGQEATRVFNPETQRWVVSDDWRKSFRESTDIETKIDWLRAVANNRGHKASAEELKDVLAFAEELLKQQEHSRLANTFWDVSQNPAASEETKQRAKALYDEYHRPGRMVAKETAAGNPEAIADLNLTAARERWEKAKARVAALEAENDKMRAEDAKYEDRQEIVQELGKAKAEESDAAGSYGLARARAGYAGKSTGAEVPSEPKITPKVLKAQKEYLMAELDKAIKAAPEDGSEKITISVPGDGEFTLFNNKKSLKKFKEENARLFPTTVTSGGLSLPSTSARSVPKVEAGDPAKVAGMFVSGDKDRYVLTASYADGQQIVSTDGRQMIRIVTKDAPGTPSAPVRIDEKGKVSTKEDYGNYPNYNQVIPQNPALMAGGVDTAKVLHVARQAEIFRNTSAAAMDKAKREKFEVSTGLQLFLNPDKSIGGRMVIPDHGEFEHNVQPKAISLGSYNPDYIINAMTAARQLGNERVDMFGDADDGAALVIRGKSHENVIMGLKGDAKMGRQPVPASLAGRPEHAKIPLGYGPLRDPESLIYRTTGQGLSTGDWRVNLQGGDIDLKEIEIKREQYTKTASAIEKQMGTIKLADWPKGAAQQKAALAKALNRPEAKIQKIGELRKAIDEVVAERSKYVNEAESRKKGAAPAETEGESLPSMDDEAFARFQAAMDERNRENEQSIAANLEAAGDRGVVRLVRTNDEGAIRTLIVAPSPDPDEAGMWRVTSFDDHGPWGHHVFKSREAALRAASGESHSDMVPGPTYYSPGEFKVEKVAGNLASAGWTEMGAAEPQGDTQYHDLLSTWQPADAVIGRMLLSPKNTPFERALLQRLRALKLKTRVKIGTESDKQRLNLPLGSGGVFNTSDVIYLFPSSVNNQRTLLHEFLHAATVWAVRNDLVFAGELQKMLDLAKKHVPEGRYGLTNLDEFIAEAFSNPEFQSDLAKIQVGDRNLLQRFVDWVRKVIGMQPSTRNLLQEVIELGSQKFAPVRGPSGVSFEGMPMESLPAQAGNPNSTAMRVLDDYFRNNPKGRADLENHMQYEDDVFKIIGDESWIIVSNALSRNPSDPVAYLKSRSQNYGIPENVTAAYLRVSSALNKFQPSPEARRKIEDWIDEQLGPKTENLPTPRQFRTQDILQDNSDAKPDEGGYVVAAKGTTNPLSNAFYSHGKFFLTPDGRWLSVEEHEGTAGSIRNQLGMPPAEGDRSWSELGMVRVVDGGDDLFFKGNPTQSQMRELRNVAIEEGRRLVTDRGRVVSEAEGENLLSMAPEPEPEPPPSEIGGPSLADVEASGEVKEAVEEAIKEGLVDKTQRMSVIDRVLGRQHLSPAVRDQGRAHAMSIFAQAGLQVQENEDGWLELTDPKTPQEAAGQRLLKLVKDEIGKYQDDQTGFLGNLINSVRNMTSEGVPAFSEALNLDLYAATQGEASHRGLMLAALAGLQKSIAYIGRRVKATLHKEYYDRFGGEAIAKVVEKIKEEVKKEMPKEAEVDQVIKDNPKLQETFDKAVEKMLPDAGGRLYRKVQSYFKPRKPSRKRMVDSALLEEAFNEIIEQAKKLGLTAPEPPKKKLTPREQLAILAKPETVQQLNDAIEQAVWDAEYNAGRMVAMKNATTEEEKAAIQEDDWLPSEEEVEEGLEDPKFAHWKEIRDNLLQYSPTTVRLVEKLIQTEFKGTEFGKKPTAKTDLRIDFNKLATAPEAEVRRVLKAYYDGIESVVKAAKSTPAMQQRILDLVAKQVGEQLDKAKARAREPMFKEPVPTGQQLPGAREMDLFKLANAGLFLDPRLNSIDQVKKVAMKSPFTRFVPNLRDLITAALETPFYRQGDLGKAFADEMVKRLGLSPGDASGARSVFNEAFSAKFKKAREIALERVEKSLTPQERREMSAKKATWKKITEAVNAGAFDTSEILQKIAKVHGWNVPTDEDAKEIKDLVEKMERLRELTQAERDAVGDDPVELQRAAADKAAVTLEKRVAIKKKIEAKWAKLTHPFSIKSKFGRQNIAAAINEMTSANLLLKVSFPFRQIIDVLTQGALHTPTRAIQAALERHALPGVVNAETGEIGNKQALWQEVSDALGDAYRTRAKAYKAALQAARDAFAGTGEARNVDRLMSRIGLFDRAADHADQLAAEGKTAQAAALRLFTFLRLGFRVAQGMDNIHGLPAEWQEMRQQVVTALRERGQSPAEAFKNADSIIGDMKAEHQLAVARAQQILESTGEPFTANDVKGAAWQLVKGRAYQRMREAGLPADAFEENNRLLRSTVGWNEREQGGIGGVVAGTMGAAKSALQRGGLPGPLLNFGNAIGTAINRSLSFTPLGFFPGLFEGSPWYKTEADKTQRKVEAAVGSSVGLSLMLLALSGALKVRNRWPRDKEERELWEREGHRPGTAEIDLGDGNFLPISLTTGPLTLVRPWLAAGGAMRDALDDKAKAQAKLNAEAEAKGLPPGEVEPLGMGDLAAIAGDTAWGSIVGGRTASGLVQSVTDYGTPNIRKTAAAFVSPMLPTLPAAQEFSRMAGVRVNPSLASFQDFLLPLPSSKAAQVNMLGDPVGNDDAVQRITQILTGGTGLPVDVSEKRNQDAYRALYVSEYRPPSINPGKGYAIDGEYRPMTDTELSNYTKLRGQYFKEELANLGEEPTKKEAAAAFKTANARALSEMGVAVPPTRATQPTTTVAATSVSPTGTRTSVVMRRPSGSSLRRGRRIPTRAGRRRSLRGSIPRRVGWRVRRGSRRRGSSLRRRPRTIYA